ncbi:MAG TPA: hypothetical protein VNM67_08700 [Thermoanaerobaculia bacterium]|nr:hypothetical protein [Thermoanaerobaculia bacterium]
MPNKSSYADLVVDQEKLLRAYEDNLQVLTPAEPQRNAVASNLGQLHDVKARQESFRAQSQGATQNLELLMRQAREDARRLRALVKGLLGTRNERLVQFQVAPNRSRVRSKPAPPPPPVE